MEKILKYAEKAVTEREVESNSSLRGHPNPAM
jgi:hypothetical protein